MLYIINCIVIVRVNPFMHPVVIKRQITTLELMKEQGTKQLKNYAREGKALDLSLDKESS